MNQLSLIDESIKNQQEIEHLFKSMVTNSIIILQRKDKQQYKQLREIWIGVGIELSDWNSETKKVLNETMDYT